MVLSSGGAFRRSPAAAQWEYCGGETRLTGLDATSSLEDLTAQLHCGLRAASKSDAHDSQVSLWRCMMCMN